MDSGCGAPPMLTAESAAVLREGICLVLGRWTALQMAVQNGWGGRDSNRKVEEFAIEILNWFAQSKELWIDDLENLLEENMLQSFSTELEDGSIEEVAVELMTIHEECLHGNYESIEKLRKLGANGNAASVSRQVIVEGDYEDSDEETSDMMVDKPNHREKLADKPDPKIPDAEGWIEVPSRKNRGKRSG